MDAPLTPCHAHPPTLQLVAAVKKSPVLLLPTHRSYMDFIILSYAFLCADVPIPIIAGEPFPSL